MNQTSSSALLNWASFNISADGKVQFNQPTTTSTAVNRIFQSDPSKILGALSANGQVYLINQNGILFGAGSQINVGGLVASSLDISTAALNNGLAQAASSADAPAFQPFQNGLPSGPIKIESGATLTANGGQVMVFAPTVENDGLIHTPDGQTILGAGQRIFLLANPTTDQSLRGLLIAVGDGGTVTNGGTANGLTSGSVGQIIAERGNVTLAGLAVNQNGRVSATTTVRANGSIILTAADTSTTSVRGSLNGVNDREGTLTLGEGSTTSVTLEGGPSDTTVDSNTQLKSQVTLTGQSIAMLDNATITAPGGNVSVTALKNAQDQLAEPAPADAARISLAPTSVIDVSGATDSPPMEDNSLAVSLRATELADFPANRNGALHGETIYVDLRQHGTNADGTSWMGTPVADISGDIAAIPHDVFWRNLTGGTITLNSSGSVLIGKGATLDISGGQIDWQSGYVKSSILLGADGKAYNVATANPNETYVGTLDSLTVADPRWGTSASVAFPGYDPRGQYQTGYVQGASAGSVSISAPAVVLDGNIAAATVQGPLQRQPSGGTPVYADQVPLGGQLTLGLSTSLGDPSQTELVRSVIFEPGFVLDSLSGSAAGGAFDLRYDPLPPQMVTSLRPDLFGPGAITRLSVAATGEITLPADTTINVGAGGSVSLAAGRVLDNGSIDAPGGSISLAAEQTPQFSFLNGNPPVPALLLNSGAGLNVTGTWVNDELAAGSQLLPLFTSGGSIKLTSQGSMAVPTGVVLDASGGAELTPTGTVVAGKGGSITVSDVPGQQGDPNVFTAFNPTLRGFALRSGGSLSVSLPEVCLSGVSCSTQGALQLQPSLVTQDGFSHVSFASTQGGLTVEPDVDLHVQQENLSLLAGVATRPSGTPFESLTAVTTLPAYARTPESLALAGSGAKPDQGLTIAQGVQLSFDPLAAVALNSGLWIIDNGIIRAPGGAVTLSVPAAEVDPTLRPYQGIWLGPSAIVDVSGVAQLTPNNLGLLSGSVLAGGSIALDARGIVVALPGSTLQADGAAALLDIPNVSNSSVSYSLENIASAGGSISLVGAQGLLVDGTLAAHAGNGPGAAGGTLSLRLDGGQARDVNDTVSPMVLDVTASDTPVVLGEGLAVPTALDGVGRVSAANIDAGGFDEVDLIARNLQSQNAVGTSFLGGFGAVQFEPGVILSPAARLIVDAPAIQGSGSGVVSLNSGYVALGSTDLKTQQVPAAPVSGNATLDVSGGFVDLVGNLDLQGFAAATISSSTDIRAVGMLLGGQTPTGFLATPGDLTLTAQQIYPATLTSYAIHLTGSDPSSTLTILGRPGTPDDVLSAGGSLLLQAPSIVNAGTIRAPFGSISLVGGTVTGDIGANGQVSSNIDVNGNLAVSATGNITLAAGSSVSVSADGLTIPFGSTQTLGSTESDWVYPLTVNGQQQFLVYGSGEGQLAPPQKAVSLNAGEIGFASGANIDLSGGGDMLAYEWIPGTGGTTDYLSSLQSPNTFAVLPGYRLSVAPIDPAADTGFTLQPGDSAYLSGGNGLAAGTYTLLPPRYALLPGAFLVTQVKGFTDLAPGQQVTQLDGSVVVSGRMVNGTTGLGDTRTSGFAIAPGSFAQTQSQYTTTSANTFFETQAQNNAAAASTADKPVAPVVPQLPQDAGALAIQVGRSLSLSGTLDAAAASGGRGATLDLSAPNIIVTMDGGAVTQGAVSVDAQQLNGLGAQSILLGGIRTFGPTATALAVDASNVEVATGVQLTAPEVMLVANQQVTLDTGSVLQASGATLTSHELLQVPAGAAMVRVSTGPQAELSSMDAPASSGPSPASQTVTVAAGASVSAPGSVLVQAGTAVDFSGGISAQGAAVQLGSNSIALGAVPDGFSGLAIRAPLVAGLTGANLELDTPNVVDVFGAVDLSLNQLTLKAPGLNAIDASSSLIVTAKQVGLQGPAVTGPASASAGSGSLQVNAGTVDLGPGYFALSGFGMTQITAAQDLSVMGDGRLVASGDLLLNAGIFQSTGAYDYAVSAAGHLATASTIPVAPTSLSAAGGALSFTAADVSLGGSFALPSGQLSAESTGSGALTQVAAGASLDLAGRSVIFDGKSVSSPGGTLTLTADSGSIDVAPSAVLDVSAGQGSGAGGSVTFNAPNGSVALGGTVRGAGGAGSTGANLTVDAQSFDLASLLNVASSGGVTGDWDLRLRGAGDLIVGSGDQIRAADVSLTADQGSVRVLGGIDVSSTQGGEIDLIAQQDVEVAGSLRTGSLAQGDRGGSIALESENGGIYVDSGAVLALAGTASPGAAAASAGSVWIRAPRNSVLSVLSPDDSTHLLRLDGTITGASQITVEGYQAYQSSPSGPVAAGGVIGAADVTADAGNPLWNDANNFVNAAAGVTRALGHGTADPRLQVIPGIEVQSSGDLTVGTTFDLSTWRFGPNLDVPGALTLRAAGNLNINASITDGFAGYDPGNPLGAFTLPATPGPSWSYRMAAGADLTSANPLAVMSASAAADAGTGGSVVIAGPAQPADINNGILPTMVRTGTGSIAIAAANDLVLTNQAAVIYTAGEAGPGTVLSELNELAYPVNGGSINISAGRDVVGTPSNQLFVDWLWRVGAPATTPQGSDFVPTAWSIAFDQFEQGVGALGGGNLTVRAGRNISDLGAAVPSIGVPLASDGSTTELNTGVLTVQAGNDIEGGKFLDMAGSASVTAGGELTAGSPQSGATLHPILALGDSQFAVSSRRDATIETILDPTLLPPAQGEADTGAPASVFATYSDQSSVSIESAGGNVTLLNNPTANNPILVTTSENVPITLVGLGDPTFPLRIFAPTLEVAALGGNINVDGSMDLWPSAHGNLDLLATGSVAIGAPGESSVHVVLSDANPLTAVPTVAAPSTQLDETALQTTLDHPEYATAGTITAPNFYADKPVHGGSFAADLQPDMVPARIVGLTGDVSLLQSSPGAESLMFFAKPLDVIAGRDIVDLGAFIQQFSAANVSAISAGRDVTYPTPRIPTGLSTNLRSVDVSGPGELEISAGRDISLGTSAGITSDGNLYNPALPAGGADVSVTAGLSGPPADAAFISKYLGAGSAYSTALVQYMEQVTGQQDLDAAAALSGFEQLSPVQQQELVQEVFFDELRAGGRSAAGPGAAHDNFTQAFNALETLFPGSNPDLAAGQTVAYNGAIDLVFSRIYTVAGGNISLFAPGGKIDVGLATPPSGLGITKGAQQLGIVAQSVGSVSALAYGDESVNQSRIFAADGGNILLWSTEGNIDAGRGSKSAISAPPPNVSYTNNGVPIYVTPPALTGSGIQTLATTVGTKPGDVDLFAPHGVVNANDAGIVAGNLTIAATAVLGTNNISVSGTSVGVPVQVTGLGISAASAGSSTAAATNTVQNQVTDQNREKPTQTPITDAAVGWLDVFVLGFGAEGCRADDVECLKRQQTSK